MDEPLIVNLAEGRTTAHPRCATTIEFEQAGAPWPETGINVRIMQPGQPLGRYHSESVQEDFLVLRGECILILESGERRLRRWDFVHFPAKVAHAFVGAGEGPCALLAIGARRQETIHYPVNKLAARHDASVSSPTDEPAVAYADWNEQPEQHVPNPWPLY